MARYITAWIDHNAVGCGVRHFVDLTSARMKTAVLFYTPTLTTFRVPLADLRGATELPLTKALARTLRQRIRQAVRERETLGLSVPRAQVKAALAALADQQPGRQP